MKARASLPPIDHAESLTLVARNRRFARMMATHLKHHTITYVLLALCLWLFQQNYRLLPNATRSIAKDWFIVRLHEPATRGDFVAFRAPKNGVYPESLWWVKRVAGVHGDRVTREGNVYRINGQELVAAQRIGLTGRALEPLDIPAEGRVLDRNEVFVVGDHPYSFDSRYAAIGVIDRAMVLGRAYAIY